MGKRVAKRGEPKLRASDELRVQLAHKYGEIVGKSLEAALYVEPWIRWTIALYIAMTLERSVSTAQVKLR